MAKAIIVGTSTGIGRALTRVLSENGYAVGLAGRKTDLMAELAGQLPGEAHVKAIDVTRPDEARRALRELIEEMGGVDVVVINSGVGDSDPDWESERRIIEVNVLGFAAVARSAMEYFMERGRGHLVGISSISALRGVSTAYSGSKAFDSTYLEGWRLRVDAVGLPIHVTDVKPGYVDTPMTAGRSGMFWVADVEEAARQIYEAIRRRQRHAYITKRWRLMAWLMKLMPYPLLARLARAGAARRPSR